MTDELNDIQLAAVEAMIRAGELVRLPDGRLKLTRKGRRAREARRRQLIRERQAVLQKGLN